MRRLLQAPDGGLPYVNSDLTDILQAQHLRSYRAMLNSMLENDSYTGNNSGIILSGCDIISAGGSNFVMSFSSSVVYIDGEFYQNDPSYQTTNQTISNATFYLKPGATSSETRILRDLTTTATVSNTRYFEHTTSPPTGPHIEFSDRGTSRYLKRVIKYFTSRTGDIYVTKSKINFDGNGDGFNDMDGFVILDSNSGVSGSPDLSGKFLVNYPSLIGTSGGTHSVTLSKSQLASHTHQTDSPAYNTSNPTVVPYFDHSHEINTGTYNIQAPDSEPGTPPLSGPDSTGGFPSLNSIFMRGGLPDQYFTGGIYDYQNSELANHKHSISTDFGNGTIGDPGSEHENRPPYYVVVYYTKK